MRLIYTRGRSCTSLRRSKYDGQQQNEKKEMGKLFTRDAKAVENSRVHYDEVAKSTSMEWRVAEIGAGPVPVFSKAPRHPITPTSPSLSLWAIIFELSLGFTD